MTFDDAIDAYLNAPPAWMRPQSTARAPCMVQGRKAEDSRALPALTTHRMNRTTPPVNDGICRDPRCYHSGEDTVSFSFMSPIGDAGLRAGTPLAAAARPIARFNHRRTMDCFINHRGGVPSEIWQLINRWGCRLAQRAGILYSSPIAVRHFRYWMPCSATF
jgi:hypothetical protein